MLYVIVSVTPEYLDPMAHFSHIKHLSPVFASSSMIKILYMWKSIKKFHA